MLIATIKKSARCINPFISLHRMPADTLVWGCFGKPVLEHFGKPVLEHSGIFGEVHFDIAGGEHSGMPGGAHSGIAGGVYSGIVGVGRLCTPGGTPVWELIGIAVEEC